MEFPHGRIWPLLLAIGGVVYVISRFILAAINKRGILGVIEKIKRKPGFAREVADSIDMTYSQKENFDANKFDRLNKFLSSSFSAGDYSILYTHEVGSNELLVFAVISFVDFDVNVAGRGDDIKKHDYIPFLFKYHRDQARLDLLSNLHGSVNEKLHREGFLTAVFSEPVLFTETGSDV